MAKWNEIVPEDMDAIQGEHALKSITCYLPSSESFGEVSGNVSLLSGKILINGSTATLLNIQFQPDSAAHLDYGFVFVLTPNINWRTASREEQRQTALQNAMYMLNGKHFRIEGTNGAVDAIYLAGPGVRVSCHLAELVQVPAPE